MPVPLDAAWIVTSLAVAQHLNQPPGILKPVQGYSVTLAIPPTTGLTRVRLITAPIQMPITIAVVITQAITEPGKQPVWTAIQTTRQLQSGIPMTRNMRRSAQDVMQAASVAQVNTMVEATVLLRKTKTVVNQDAIALTPMVFNLNN